MNVEASQAIINGLKAAGVDMLAILPDHGFDRVQKMAAEDPSFLIAPVSNEGVGVGMCAGAYLGGKTPAIMIPTSGFLVAVWPLASLNILYGIPLLLLIPYRGDIGDAQSVMRTYQFTTEPFSKTCRFHSSLSVKFPKSKEPSKTRWHPHSLGKIQSACSSQGRHYDEAL
jgi:sulfopyruvate decarboxylase subunit alpha